MALYPLAVVLDGNKLFDLYVGLSTYFSTIDNAPQQIIVGINHNETYNNDVSYNITNSELTTDSRLFYNFIRDELVLYTEANYRTSPFLTIVGEGLAANFITNFLKERNPIFNAYIHLNPSFAPDINDKVNSYDLDRYGKLDNTFYFYMSGNPLTNTNRKIRVNNFGTFMKSVDISNFNVTYDPLSSSTQSSSVVGEGLSRAFSQVFGIYSGITPEEFETKIKDLSTPDAITYLETKYLDLEFLFGTNLGIRKRDIVAIENIIIEKENGDYLINFGEMILKLFPRSEMGHYYKGLYYEMGKDYESAIEQYRLGYGKMDPADPNADKFYQNVERLLDK